MKVPFFDEFQKPSVHFPWIPSTVSRLKLACPVPSDDCREKVHVPTRTRLSPSLKVVLHFEHSANFANILLIPKKPTNTFCERINCSFWWKMHPVRIWLDFFFSSNLLRAWSFHLTQYHDLQGLPPKMSFYMKFPFDKSWKIALHVFEDKIAVGTFLGHEMKKWIKHSEMETCSAPKYIHKFKPNWLQLPNKIGFLAQEMKRTPSSKSSASLTLGWTSKWQKKRRIFSKKSPPKKITFSVSNKNFKSKRKLLCNFFSFIVGLEHDD